MIGLKQLVHEIHRRSLWQVTGIYLAASWGVLQVVEVLTETAGLPDWTPTMALVLLLLGLPICVATAFVQEGMPGQEGPSGDKRESLSDIGSAPDGGGGSAADPERTPPVENLAPGTGSLDRPTTRPSTRHRLFTWRNVVLFGVGAAALIGFTLAGYFAMWAAGLGPVGSLVAQGVIESGDRVVLADFDDPTGEGLGDAVTEALRVDLSEAEVLDLVPDVDVAETLARMQVEPGTALGADLAREVAVREGFEGVLEGEVAPVGTGYSVTAMLRESSTGRPIASFRVAAEGPDRLIAAIDKLSQDIREKSGESLRAIKANAPLERVTTGSLEALRRYSEAVRTFGSGDWDRTIALLEEAVEIDPAFAMAWRKLAAAYQNTLSDPGRGIEAAIQAFEHRDRLSERERYHAEAYYYDEVVQDREAAIAAYEDLVGVDPDDGTALNNLANAYQAVGDLARARELYRRALESPSSSNTAFLNLAANHMAEGDLDGAADVIEQWGTTRPESRAARVGPRFYLAMKRRDVEGAGAMIEGRMEDTALPVFDRSNAAVMAALVAVWRGRLDESHRLLLRSEELGAQVSPALGWFRREFTALMEMLVGDPEWALAHLEEGLADEAFGALDPRSRQYLFAARLFALAGRPDRVADMAQAWSGSMPRAAADGVGALHLQGADVVARAVSGEDAGLADELERIHEGLGCRNDDCRPWESAAVADATGDMPRAIDLYENILRRGVAYQLDPLFEMHAILRLGPLHEEAGHRAEAIAAYQRVVDLWSDGDDRARQVVDRYQSRIDALIEGSPGG